MKKILCLTSVLLVGCSNEFDVICGYYDQLAEHSKLEQLSPSDKYSFIKDKAQELDPKSNAYMLWHLSDNIVPIERYDLFKYGVEDISGQEWSCPSMKALAATTETEKVYVEVGLDGLPKTVTSMEDAVFDE